MSRRVTVVGGGLAGMVAALRLAQRGYDVVLLDASERLGGKAGAERAGSEYDEHGWHLFPLWYLNIWSLVDELGIRDSFVDRSRYAYMAEGQYPRLRYLDTPFAPRTAWHNTFHGVLPPEYSILYQYTLIDLLSQPVRKRAQLDQVTINGFARSRFYTTEVVVDQLEDTVSRASAIESYEMSAMTVRNVTRYWLKYNDPWFRILRTNLQAGLIAPLEQALRNAGVEIRFGITVTKVDIQDRRIRDLEIQQADGSSANLNVEDVILAVPLESLRRVLPFDVIEQSPALAGIYYLRSRAMAGMTIYFKNKVDGMPAEHVNFIGSPYDLSVIDVSQVWPGEPRTILCVVASDFTPLLAAPVDVAQEKLISDLAHYLPFVKTEPIDRINLQPHDAQPLFMNTAGAWPRRPQTTTQVENLFIAGDFCQTPVDLTCMEGAVTAGLLAAEAIRSRDAVGDPIKIQTPAVYPRLLFIFLKILLFPAAMIAYAVHFFRRPADKRETSVAARRIANSRKTT